MIVEGHNDNLACVSRTADFCDLRPASIHEADRGELKDSPTSTETNIYHASRYVVSHVRLDIMIEWKSETSTSHDANVDWGGGKTAT